MRLIDANILLNTIRKQEMWNIPDFVYESIQNAPTIEAIPIEWIVNKWAKEKCYDKQGRYNGEGYDHWYNMIEDWEKENAGILQRD